MSIGASRQRLEFFVARQGGGATAIDHFFSDPFVQHDPNIADGLPQFKTDAISGEGPGDWATYQLRIVFQKLQMALHAKAKAWGLVREPDAGDLHVRFDERDVETESRLNQ